jgi:hypothetical protein
LNDGLAAGSRPHPRAMISLAIGFNSGSGVRASLSLSSSGPSILGRAPQMQRLIGTGAGGFAKLHRMFPVRYRCVLCARSGCWRFGAWNSEIPRGDFGRSRRLSVSMSRPTERRAGPPRRE